MRKSGEIKVIKPSDEFLYYIEIGKKKKTKRLRGEEETQC